MQPSNPSRPRNELLYWHIAFGKRSFFTWFVMLVCGVPSDDNLQNQKVRGCWMNLFHLSNKWQWYIYHESARWQPQSMCVVRSAFSHVHVKIHFICVSLIYHGLSWCAFGTLRTLIIVCVEILNPLRGDFCHAKNKTIFACHFSTLWWRMFLKIFLAEDMGPCILYDHCHGCW